MGADAVVKPLAMVVKVRDAFVAFATVFGIRANVRSTDLAIIFEKLIWILLSFEHIRQEFVLTLANDRVLGIYFACLIFEI